MHEGLCFQRAVPPCSQPRTHGWKPGETATPRPRPSTPPRSSCPRFQPAPPGLFTTPLPRLGACPVPVSPADPPSPLGAPASQNHPSGTAAGTCATAPVCACLWATRGSRRCCLGGPPRFSKDESVLKCQTNFPNYLAGHFLPGALEDGGGTFHSLRAGMVRSCMRELLAASGARGLSLCSSPVSSVSQPSRSGRGPGRAPRPGSPKTPPENKEVTGA